MAKHPAKQVFILLEVTVIWISSGLFYIFCENIHHLLQSWCGETSDSHQAMQKNLKLFHLGTFYRKDDTEWCTSLKCPWKYFLSHHFHVKKVLKALMEKIQYSTCFLRAFQQTYRSAAKASIFILIFAYNSSEEIQVCSEELASSRRAVASYQMGKHSPVQKI